MDKLFKLLFFLFATVVPVMTSCSDDKDDPNPDFGGEEVGKVNPARVFPEGIPTQVGDYIITTNSDGLVTKITDGEYVTTFDYAVAKTKDRSSSPLAEYDIIMKTEGESESFFKLNNQGYIEYAIVVEEDDSLCIEWRFKYDGNGRLIEVKCSEDNEIITLNYNTEGDLTSMRDDDAGVITTVTVGYTDAAHASPILNKSGIMLYSECFEIYLGTMDKAYYAGLLGKGTAHLPLNSKEVYHGDLYDHTFSWNLNSNDMPVKFTDIDGEKPYDLIIRW